RQGSRRAGRQLQGAGQGIALELLRGPAIRRRISARRTMEPLQSSRAAAEIRRFRIPDLVVVGRGESRQDGWTLLNGSFRAPLSRRHVLGLGIGAAGAAWLRPARAVDAGPELHGMSVFGDLKYPPDFHHFDYVNLAAPKGGTFSTIPSVRTNNQSYQTFNSLNAY